MATRHRLLTRETMHAEMTPDVYAGPTCDQQQPRWHGYCEGDKESESFTDPIALDCKHYPPGTIVTVALPCCPQCGTPRQEDGPMRPDDGAPTKWQAKCDCGFDWDKWVLEVYS
jgi:hypothetical protein